MCGGTKGSQIDANNQSEGWKITSGMTPGGMMPQDIGKTYVHMIVFQIEREEKLNSSVLRILQRAKKIWRTLSPSAPRVANTTSQATLSPTREYSRRWGLGLSARGEWSDVTRPKCSEKPHGSAWTQASTRSIAPDEWQAPLMASPDAPECGPFQPHTTTGLTQS